ncbi:hypothetical protein PTTG_28028, partial [Puccinia triticina 1-1 BBBD Race 1]
MRILIGPWGSLECLQRVGLRRQGRPPGPPPWRISCRALPGVLASLLDVEASAFVAVAALWIVNPKCFSAHKGHSTIPYAVSHEDGCQVPRKSVIETGYNMGGGNDLGPSVSTTQEGPSELDK